MDEAPEDPGLPELETIARWIRRTRQSLDLTQTEVGERAHLSPSQLSRLENAEGNPSYEAVYRVYRALKSQQGPQVDALLRAKRERTDGGLEFEYVTVDDSCARVNELMGEYNISQVPVLDEDGGEAVGSVSEATLMELAGSLEEVSVGEVAGDPYPEVPVTTTAEVARNLLRAHPAVLVMASRDVDGDVGAIVGKYAGILTKFDLRGYGARQDRGSR